MCVYIYIYKYTNVQGSLIEVCAGRQQRAKFSACSPLLSFLILLFDHHLHLLRLQSSLEKIHFLLIVFHLEYTVIKRPNGIRSRIPGNQSSLEYNIYIIILIFSSLFFCPLFYFTTRHIFMATFFPFLLLFYF